MLKNIVANWRTTTAGAAAMLGAVADVLTQVSSGHYDPERLKMDALAFVTGLGLALGKDANVTGVK